MKLKITIDRLEADKAVLIAEEMKTPLILPRTFLPKEAKEGDTLLIRLEIDKKATEQAREKTAKLIKKLS